MNDPRAELHLEPVPDAAGYLSHPSDPGEPGYPEHRTRWSVHLAETDLLRALAYGRHVLEIGTGTGLSALAMRETAASVVTVDIDPWVHETVFPVLRQRGVQCWTERPEPGPWDLVFIDGCHLDGPVEDDTRWALDHVPTGGLLVWHDLHWYTVRAGMEAAGVGIAKVSPPGQHGLAYYLATPAGLAVLVRP